MFGARIANAKRHVSRFQGYGGWDLVHFTDMNGRPEIDVDFVSMLAMKEANGSATDLKVVEVEIYNPRTCFYEYLTGFTSTKGIPPHRRDHRDGDCRVTLIHHFEIKQLGG